MAKRLVPDELWEVVESLIPKKKPSPKGGRPRVPDRQCLEGILFVLKTGVPWEYLPAEMGCGSGMTCWRRLRDWQEAGVWQTLWETLLNWLGIDGQVDWSHAVVDSSSTRAVLGGPRPGRIPRTEPKPAPNATC